MVTEPPAVDCVIVVVVPLARLLTFVVVRVAPQLQKKSTTQISVIIKTLRILPEIGNVEIF